jgi:N-acetyl sugar amidotransferase
MGNIGFDEMSKHTTSGTILDAEQPVLHVPAGETHEPRPYKICSRCIMDTTDPDIAFDESGVCNHCHHYDRLARERLFASPAHRGKLEALIASIKTSGKGREYDCVIGVSGGVDSTYVAYRVKELGLRPLAVHLDNGWDSELAVANIQKTLSHLGIDLYTYVIDWEEFRDLQLAFLKASTPDSEIPTDHAIMAILYRIAARENVRYIILGTNVISESVLPLKWGYGYADLKYIRSVQKRFGKKKLKSFPGFSLVQLFYYMALRRIRLVSILNYGRYDKKQAMEIIQKKLGWIDYGGKHYESIYTRFLQAYILPRKFNIDKRKAHYANLALSGQMTREEALGKLGDVSCTPATLKEDREYVIKKLGLAEAEFESIMALPRKTFLDYPTHYATLERVKRLRNKLNAIRRRLRPNAEELRPEPFSS